MKLKFHLPTLVRKVSRTVDPKTRLRALKRSVRKVVPKIGSIASFYRNMAKAVGSIGGELIGGLTSGLGLKGSFTRIIVLLALVGAGGFVLLKGTESYLERRADSSHKQ